MKVLVTGGTGFLGRALARRLLERGDEVRTFSRGDDPELRGAGVDLRRGDLADAAAVGEAVAGREVVFHVGAKVGASGPREDYRRTNVVGTENVIAACREHGVAKLVYTSTPSVVHAGGDIEGGDESLPYPEHFEAAYPETKARAERSVLAANGETLSTVALRPHLVWGPGDRHLIPRLLARARSGRLAWIGGGWKKIDATYIDNAVDAHLLAADGLEPAAPAAGCAYFIAQGEPVAARTLSNAILEVAGLPPVSRSIPKFLAFGAAALAEAAYAVFGLSGEPPLTRFLVRQATTAHWYDLSAARRDLGYAPAISTAEGLARLREHFAKQASAR